MKLPSNQSEYGFINLAVLGLLLWRDHRPISFVSNPTPISEPKKNDKIQRDASKFVAILLTSRTNRENNEVAEASRNIYCASLKNSLSLQELHNSFCHLGVSRRCIGHSIHKAFHPLHSSQLFLCNWSCFTFKIEKSKRNACNSWLMSSLRFDTFFRRRIDHGHGRIRDVPL